MLENLFMTLLSSSVTTSAIILCLKLSAGFFNKFYAAKWKYWIWLVLALRLIIPFNFSFSAPPVTVNIPSAAIPAFINAAPVQQNTDMPPQDGATDIAPLPETNTFTLTEAFMLLWAIGGVLFLSYQFFGYFIFKKKAVRWSKVPASRQINNILHQIMADMKLEKEITVLINEDIASPLMTGFMNPVLILPNEDYTETDLNFILRHELTHYKRYDLWYKLFLLFVNAVHWFNPFVYLLFREASADLELSCDDTVISGFSNGERKAYSETILSSITAQKSARMALSTYFHGGQKTIKNRFSNILNTEKKRNGTPILLTVLLTVCILGSLFACDMTPSENKLLTKLGYTRALLTDICDSRTTFSGGDEDIDNIVVLLPLPDYREYKSFSSQTEPTKEINIVYEINDNYTRGGNGLDPFYDTVEQNNALLLFASVDGLEKVNFLSYENQELTELNRTDSYTIDDLAAHFGDIQPLDMSVSALYNTLGSNIHLSEFYFAHYSRLYLGAAPENVSYRNGEPEEARQQPDGSAIWIYRDFGSIYNDSHGRSVEPESIAIYYFGSPQAEGDNLFGLYATRFIHADNYKKTYDDITELFGDPAVNRNMSGDKRYIAYPLAAEHRDTNAYFVLHNNTVIEEGVMYGNDYTILEFE